MEEIKNIIRDFFINFTNGNINNLIIFYGSGFNKNFHEQACNGEELKNKILEDFNYDIKKDKSNLPFTSIMSFAYNKKVSIQNIKKHLHIPVEYNEKIKNFFEYITKWKKYFNGNLFYITINWDTFLDDILGYKSLNLLKKDEVKKVLSKEREVDESLIYHLHGFISKQSNGWDDILARKEQYGNLQIISNITENLRFLVDARINNNSKNITWIIILGTSLNYDNHIFSKFVDLVDKNKNTKILFVNTTEWGNQDIKILESIYENKGLKFLNYQNILKKDKNIFSLFDLINKIIDDHYSFKEFNKNNYLLSPSGIYKKIEEGCFKNIHDLYTKIYCKNNNKNTLIEIILRYSVTFKKCSLIVSLNIIKNKKLNISFEHVSFLINESINKENILIWLNNQIIKILEGDKKINNYNNTEFWSLNTFFIKNKQNKRFFQEAILNFLFYLIDKNISLAIISLECINLLNKNTINAYKKDIRKHLLKLFFISNNSLKEFCEKYFPNDFEIKKKIKNFEMATPRNVLNIKDKTKNKKIKFVDSFEDLEKRNLKRYKFPFLLEGTDNFKKEISDPNKIQKYIFGFEKIFKKSQKQDWWFLIHGDFSEIEIKPKNIKNYIKIKYLFNSLNQQNNFYRRFKIINPEPDYEQKNIELYRKYKEIKYLLKIAKIKKVERGAFRHIFYHEWFYLLIKNIQTKRLEIPTELNIFLKKFNSNEQKYMLNNNKNNFNDLLANLKSDAINLDISIIYLNDFLINNINASTFKKIIKIINKFSKLDIKIDVSGCFYNYLFSIIFQNNKFINIKKRILMKLTSNKLISPWFLSYLKIFFVIKNKNQIDKYELLNLLEKISLKEFIWSLDFFHKENSKHSISFLITEKSIILKMLIFILNIIDADGFFHIYKNKNLDSLYYDLEYILKFCKQSFINKKFSKNIYIYLLDKIKNPNFVYDGNFIWKNQLERIKGIACIIENNDPSLKSKISKLISKKINEK